MFGATIFTVGQCLRRHVQHLFLILWGCLSIGLAVPLAGIASFAITETPFILLVTISLSQTSRFLETGKRPALIWAAASASLAILTRYIGVTLIITIIPLLLIRRGVAPWEKARNIGLYLLISVPPVCLWFLQNLLFNGKFDGSRATSPWTLPEVMDKFLSDMSEWIFLYPPPGDAAAILTGIALLSLAAYVGWTLISVYMEPRAWVEWRSFLLFGGFALVYLAFITAFQASIEIVPLGNRYLYPLYVPFLMAAVVGLDKLLNYAQGGKVSEFVGRSPTVIRALVLEKRKVNSHSIGLAVVLPLFLWLS